MFYTSCMPYKRLDKAMAFIAIKKEAISLADFKWGIFFLCNVLMESIWLGNNAETLSENWFENFLVSTSRTR